MLSQEGGPGKDEQFSSAKLHQALRIDEVSTTIFLAASIVGLEYDLLFSLQEMALVLLPMFGRTEANGCCRLCVPVTERIRAPS